MRSPLMLSIAAGSAAAGALLSALVFLLAVPAGSHESMHPAHRHQEQAAAMPFCSVSSNSRRPSFHSEMAEVNSRMHEGMDIVPSGDVNQDFIRMMIPHHQGAIDMALVLLKHEPAERVKRLAQSIIVEQSQEIIYMRTLHNPPLTEPSVQSVRKDLP